MKNDLTCEVVRDLLPSYVDGLTNDVSNQAVEQHMKTCENCRKLYREMREPMNGDEVSEINNEQKANFKVPSEIDYLKKIRKKIKCRCRGCCWIRQKVWQMWRFRSRMEL